MKVKFYAFIFIFVFLAIIAGVIYSFIHLAKGEQLSSRVIINNKTINVELAEIPSQHAQGLSNRPFLETDSGMLFIFTDKKMRSFWMKDMKIPLDIIWITDNKIVGIVRDAPILQNNEVPTFISPEPVNYVLEINAGWTEKNQIKTGDVVEMKLK